LFLAHRQFRLAQGPERRGLSVDAEGVALAGVALLRKTTAGFEPRWPGEIDVLTKAAYGAAVDAEALRRGLVVAANALNGGDVGRAMVATLHLRLPGLDEDGAARVAAVDAVLAKYSADQPRDWHGRWTTEGGGGGPDHLDGGRSARHLVEAGGGAEDGEAAGMGDNQGPSLEPVGPTGEAPPLDPVLPTPKVPEGWDEPARVENGVQRPAERVPRLRDGQLWPTADPDAVLRILASRGGTMKIYVPFDGKGPILVGSGEGDFRKPSGYDEVYLRGIPRRTVSRGVDTDHAQVSVEQALLYAGTNKYSEIFFNRSFSTISNGRYGSQYRADVVGHRRPTLDPGGEYDVYEVLSPRQSGPARERVLRPAVPGIGNFNSRAYKLLLKLLRTLRLS